MKTLAASIAAIALIGTRAFAADMVVKMPVKAPPPPPAPVYSWTGFYLGAGLGFRSTVTDPTVTDAVNAGAGLAAICAPAAAVGGCVTSEPANNTAFRFSPYAGFNWQLAPQWVIGIEGDIGLSNKTTTLNGMFYPLSSIGITPTAADHFSVKTAWDASVRGRAGFLITPTVMTYVTGGPAWLHVEATSSCSTNPLLGSCDPTFSRTFGTPVITDTATKLGWTIGGGIEAALWSNWIARAEYRYSDFGAITNTDVRSGPLNPLTVTYELPLKSHTVTFGLAYKFGDPVTMTPIAAALPVKAPVTTNATALSWTGTYLGLGLGIRSTLTDPTVTAASDAGNSLASMCSSLAAGGGCVTSEPLNDTAFRLSPYLGYDWQVARQWVVGIEADGGFADKTATLNGMVYPFNSFGISGVAADTFNVKTTWDASVRGRAGFLVTPTVLTYATGGAAWLHVEATSACKSLAPGSGRCEPGAFSPSVITDSATKLGWTIGGGIEAALWSNWIARAEYRYADFGTITNTDVRANGGGVPPAPLPLVVTYNLPIKSHIATFGLAYKFN